VQSSSSARAERMLKLFSVCYSFCGIGLPCGGGAGLLLAVLGTGCVRPRLARSQPVGRSAACLSWQNMSCRQFLWRAVDAYLCRSSCVSSWRAARRAPRPAAGCALLRNGRLAAAGRKWCRAGGGALQLMTVLVSGGPVCLPQPDQSAGCACSRRFAALCVCSHCLFMCLSLSQAALAVTLKCGPALVLLMEIGALMLDAVP